MKVVDKSETYFDKGLRLLSGLNEVLVPFRVFVESYFQKSR
jgi:hypothetical protein